MKFSKKEILVFVGIVAIFLVLRLPAVHYPYHQDEYKWPIIVNSALTAPGGIPHPPIGEFIYKTAGQIIGYDNFRIVPLVFSFVNLFLLFYLVKNIFSQKAAFWSIFLFVASFYSVLASLMVDTDGAIMLFFFLLSAIFYYKWKEFNFAFRSKWLLFVLAAMALGFLVKASFIIPIGAFVLDFAIEKGIFRDIKKIFKYFLAILGGMFMLAIILYISKSVFPYFRLEASLEYWEHFWKLGERGWSQTFIQFSKSILYLSPLLILPAVLADREILKKTRPLVLFIILGLLFYLVIFDFSTGALDRYFQFLIIPLCIIAGAVFARVFDSKETKLKKKDFILVSIITASIFAIQFFNHFVPPLYPKAEWITRAVSLKWNFLFPFTGGSGPTGFYISFLFIALIWICSIIFALSQLKTKNIKKRALFYILILGILYNGIFIEEYLFGKINGSAPKLFKEAKEFIIENKDIKKVVVYNDIGGYEIQQIGKYQRRMYATPQSEQVYKDFFSNFSGHVLYIDIPRIGENNFYSNYLNSCKNIYEKQDKYITAKILDCQK